MNIYVGPKRIVVDDGAILTIREILRMAGLDARLRYLSEGPRQYHDRNQRIALSNGRRFVVSK